MSFPGEQFASELAKRLVDKTIKELGYFRHFDDHIQNFVLEHNSLVAKRNEVQKDIDDAQKNQNQVEDSVENWIEIADDVIQGNTRVKQTWSYSRCPHWQYRQGKKLAKRIQATKDHIQKCSFDRIARPDNLPGIEYHASKNFMDFKSRRTEFNQLMEALKDGSHYMIGLQGMGGTGKTTLATQVGKQLEESKAFEKVIFVVVSNPPDVNKIQGDIARPLGLHLDQRVEADHSKILWSRLSKSEEKLLIILDDVWTELSLKEIGIPSGHDIVNCKVLITSRYSKVCHAMECQQTIHLHTLGDEDALKLFLFHAGSDGDDSLVQDFVKECGGLPIAIVTLAITLRNFSDDERIGVLTNLRDSKAFVDVDEDLVKVYSCLKLSYDNLNNEKAKKLFILCSIFPEDYEFPVNLIIRIGIGSGIVEEVDEYDKARTQVVQLKKKLIDSSLLLKVEEKGCIKMHDLVREVAQWIAKEDIQVIMDSRTTLKANRRYMFWSANDFPGQFDATKLEILLLWISGNVLVNDPKAFFTGMSRLKILFLLCENARKVPPPSLPQSLFSLKNIHTLILDGWEIGDISIVMNLQSLVTLEFKNCLILELPRDIMELKELRWLGLRKCEIQKNNPFEVIEKCSQLEELHFVGNYNVTDWKPGDDKETDDEIAPDVSSSTLRMFSIACDGFKCFARSDNGLIKCFNPECIKHLISDAMFHYLVGKAEVLELGKTGQTGWKSLVPDIIHVKDGVMNNLIKLYLYESGGIELLIDNNKCHRSNITVFSRLVELHMDGVDVTKLYCGAMPSGFLLQLQVLKLNMCMELQKIFFDGNLKLPHLRVLEIIDCPKFQPSIFQLSVARSLVQLEELVIYDCKELESLIAHESFEEEMIVVDSPKNYTSLFPELKSLKIIGCYKLEMVLPLLLAGDLPKLKELYLNQCEELKYIFGEYRDLGQVLQQEIMLPSLTEVQLYEVPSFISIFQKCKKWMPRPYEALKEDSMDKYKKSEASAFSQALGCCFMVPTKDANIEVSNAISQESCASSKMIETFHTAECLMRQPLRLKNIRLMTLWVCSNLKSLFSVSIAKTMIMLEKLDITGCEELKHIITNEEEDDVRLNCNSILPKLQSLNVSHCNKLEFIFPSTLSGGLQNLKSIVIYEADELKYVFGRYNDEECVSTENENKEHYIRLPALESLHIQYVPNMISIGIRIYQTRCPSLQNVEESKELMSEGAKESKTQDTVNVEMPHTPSLGFQYVLDFCNLQKVNIWLNKKLKTLFSISACKSLPQLSTLIVLNCEELVNVVEDDCNDHHHKNYSSFFPKLEYLSIINCNKLEFIFPFSLFGTLQKLKSLEIKKAAELKYIFGKCHHENESDKLHIHLPALEQLAFVGVPKMINNIRTKKYQLRLSSPHLQSISMSDLQDFNAKSFPELMADLQLSVTSPKKLTRVDLSDSKIEEVLNLEGMEIEGPIIRLSLKDVRLINLCELRHIWKAPKYILSLINLETLEIRACKKIRAIFNVSIVKSLPQLSNLRVEDCDELVDIIEESEGDHFHEPCFPKLWDIDIKRCNSLKFIFSISTCVMFPKLEYLTIVENSELEQVFIHKQDDMPEVFPMLSTVTLRKLPRLITIFEGIDFHILEDFEVEDCPKYKEIGQIQEGFEYGDSENQAARSASPDFVESSKEAMKTSVEEVGSSSMNYKDTEKEVGRVVPDPASKVSTMSCAFQSIDSKLNERAEEDPTSKDVVAATMVAIDLAPSNLPNVTSSVVSQVRGSQSSSSTLIDKETEKEVGNVIPFSKLPATTDSDQSIIENIVEDTTPVIARINTSSFHSQAEDSRSNPLAQVASLKESNEQGSKENDATEEATVAIQSIDDSDLRKQTRSSEGIEKKAVIKRASQSSKALTWTNLEGTKDTMQQGLEENYTKDYALTAVGSTNSDSMKQATRPIDNLYETDSALSAKEKAKGTGEDATATTHTSPMSAPFKRALISVLSSNIVVSNKFILKENQLNTTTCSFSSCFMKTTKETGAHSRIQEEAESEKPIKAIIPQVIPSIHQQSQIVEDVTSSPKLGFCEIFKCVELKHGEAALLAEALEQYPQLLLPREHRTDRIIGLSYRVLVDILVMLANRTPSTITPSEKSILKENLSEAIFLGFDKDWVESVHAKVFESNVSTAEEEIQAMEVELGEIDSQREKLIEKMTMFKDIISAKDKPFGI